MNNSPDDDGWGLFLSEPMGAGDVIRNSVAVNP